MSPQVSDSQSPRRRASPSTASQRARLLVVGQRVRVDGDDAVRARAGSTGCRRWAAGGCARASRRRHPAVGRRPARVNCSSCPPEMIATSTRSASAISSSPMRGIDRGSWTARACRRGRTRRGGGFCRSRFSSLVGIRERLRRRRRSLSAVGVTGFEPAASSSRTTRATKLRHTPWQPPESTRCAEPWSEPG